MGWRQLTIGKKIATGFGFVLLLFFAAGILSYVGVDTIVSNAEEVIQGHNLEVELAQREVDHLVWAGKVNDTIFGAPGTQLNVQTDPTQCGFGKWFYGEGRKEAEGMVPSLKPFFDKIEAPHKKLHESALAIIDAGKAVTGPEGQQRTKDIYTSQTVPSLKEVRELLNEIRKEAESKTMTEEVMLSAAHRTQLTMVILVACALVLGILLASFISRGIVSTLKRISTDMATTSEQVASASGEISGTSESLASGASEQAASLEETSASLEEITAMTQQNAENVRQADNLMKNASQAVKDADTSMQQLTESMQQIATASEETQRIVKTIDEIAFQTNLLALNAAVEAARAGEAGAGFAVVADEVRNLAMRAAESSRNTAQLIESTVNKVNLGKKMAEETNLSFAKAAEAADKVTALMGEIAAGSEEQARGVAEVGRAVADIDKVVQSTAANAEESAAAAEELNAQAQGMKDNVGLLLTMVGGGGSQEPSSTRHQAGGPSTLPGRRAGGKAFRPAKALLGRT